jgi:hypothetical protein
MSQAGKSKLNYRCPACFIRDLDIDLFYDRDSDEYYCLRCQFTGNEKAVLNGNEMAQVKYKRMLERITDFDNL